MAEFEFIPKMDTKNVNDLESQQGSRFLPEIPKSDFSVNLPQELLDQIDTVQKSKQVSRVNERQRLDREAKALLEANKEINSAENQIQKANSSLFLDFAGIFDDDYNREYQQGKIKAAQRKVTTVQLENQIASKREQLDLKEAAAPLEEYMQIIGFQKEKLALTTAQANAIMQSNQAKVQMQQMLQGLVTKEQRDQIKKTGNYNDVITQKFITESENAERKARNDFTAAELANSRNMLAYKNEKIQDGLNSLPIATKRSLLQQAESDDKSLIQLPGTKLSVTAGELRTSLSKSLKADEEALANVVKTDIALAKNNAEVSANMSKVQNVSSNFVNTDVVNGGSPSLNLNNLNLLNVDDELIMNTDFTQVHPNVRPQFQQYLQSMANANAKRDRGESVTRDDLAAIRVTGENLSKVVNETETQLVESMPKEAKDAQKEWNLNGRMQNSDNAASMLVVNSLTMPNLGGDPALESAMFVFHQNLADIIVGTKQDWSKLTPEERTNAIFQTIAGQNLDGNEKSRELALKAMHATNKNGVSPLLAWSNNKSVTVMKKAMENLAEKRPDLKNFLLELGRRTRYQDHQQIGIELANASFQSQLQNAELEDNILSKELIAEMDAVLAEDGAMWNKQLNPVRGSLMTLMFKQTPSKIVDDALTASFGANAGSAWFKLKQTVEPKQSPFGPDYKFGSQISDREARKSRTNPFELDPDVPIITQ